MVEILPLQLSSTRRAFMRWVPLPVELFLHDRLPNGLGRVMTACARSIQRSSSGIARLITARMSLGGECARASVRLTWMSRSWREVCDDAGIKTPIQVMDLRAKAGADKAESAGDIRQAQTKLGHSSVVMVEHYVRERRGARVTPSGDILLVAISRIRWDPLSLVEFLAGPLIDITSTRHAQRTFSSDL